MIRFTKMHGAGNDYIFVYAPDNDIPTPSEASIRWSRHHFCVGSDGLVLIDKGDGTTCDFTMRIFNNDGSEATMCGNGIRCLAKYVYDHKLTDKRSIRVGTGDGVKTVDLVFDGDRVVGASVDMGLPRIEGHARPISEDGTLVWMGNPHFVVIVDEYGHEALNHMGDFLERFSWPGRRSNVEYVTVSRPNYLRVSVWERGSGRTLASGTGACAAAVAARNAELIDGDCDVQMEGGSLHVSFRSDGHVVLTGPAVAAFDGLIDI